MSKQLMLALGAGGAAAAAVVASAASIGSVNSTDLGAGTQVVASCDSTIDVSYTTSYNSTLGGYVVATVTLDNVAAACAGQAIDVTVAGAGGAELGSAAGTMPVSPATSSGSLTVTPKAPLTSVSAEDVVNVAVVISGAHSA